MKTIQKIAKALLDAAEPCTAGQLGEITGVDPNTCSSTVRGLVERKAAKIVSQGGRGVASTYAAADRAALQARVDGSVAPGRKAGTARKAAAKRTKARRAIEDRKDESSEPPGAKRRKTKRKIKAKTRRKVKPKVQEPTLSYFLDEDAQVQIMRADGEGEVAIVPRADALRLSAFLQRCAPILEAA